MYVKRSKKLIQINTVCNVSTGHIMAEIQQKADTAGYRTLSLYGRRQGYPDLRCIRFGNGISFWLHVILTTVTDLHGLGSVYDTRRLVRILRKEQPDILHLHNLHGYYLNYPILFDYIKKEYTGRVIWTFHDCWPFTGHCAFYTMAACNKWQTGCYACPCRKEYPISLGMDASRENYLRKKKYFTGVRDLTITVPSEWMRAQVAESFMKDYPIRVIHNGIDFDRFHYIQNDDVYRKYGIAANKKIYLGVAAYWTKRKGMQDLISLAEKLPKDSMMILVGISQNQKRKLPSNVIGIQRTEDADELIRLYSASNIFINPSMEESFSMVTIEAMACGLPVIVLDTSAVAELVNENTGVVLHTHETEDYLTAIGHIQSLWNTGRIDRNNIIKHAREYAIENMTMGMMELYGEDNGK